MDDFPSGEFAGERSKVEVIAALKQFAERHDFEIIEENLDKPWGAYLRFSGKNADAFCELFFADVASDADYANLERSPKLLLVAPKKRLSWQYHSRRAERWRFLTSGAFYHSKTDEPGSEILANSGDEVQFTAEERHRLCGGENWTVVAEIWQHTTPGEPSDEADIVRLEDDFQRET